MRVVCDGGLEEVNHIFVLAVGGAVTGDVEGAEAGGVLGEFVGPEVGVGAVLGDPESMVRLVDVERNRLLREKGSYVLVHVIEQIQFTKALDKCTNVGTFVGWNDCVIAWIICDIGTGNRIILTSVIA